MKKYRRDYMFLAILLNKGDIPISLLFSNIKEWIELT